MKDDLRNRLQVRVLGTNQVLEHADIYWYGMGASGTQAEMQEKFAERIAVLVEQGFDLCRKGKTARGPKFLHRPWCAPRICADSLAAKLEQHKITEVNGAQRNPVFR